MNDTLSSLVAAYRTENPGTALDSRALRERVLAAAWRRRRQRARLVSWLLPIAALLVGSGALAASAPARARVTHLLERMAVAVSLTPVERHAPSRHHASARRSPLNPPHPELAAADNPALPAPPPPVAPAPAVTLDPMPEIPRASGALIAPLAAASAAHAPAAAQQRVLAVTAPLASPSAVSSPAASSPAASSPAASSPAGATRTFEPVVPPGVHRDAAFEEDLAAYRVAHHFHFVLADDARALKAWNGYLARFPSGTFAPEARLNRAVCLARLGEEKKARASLDAIAGGKFGKDGRKQATQLLEALDEKN